MRQTICFNGDCEQKQQGNTGRSETSNSSTNQGHQGLAQLTVPLSLRPPPCLQSAMTLLCGVLTKKPLLETHKPFEMMIWNYFCRELKTVYKYFSFNCKTCTFLNWTDRYFLCFIATANCHKNVLKLLQKHSVLDFKYSQDQLCM